MNNFAFIANYLWQRSMENIDAILSEDERCKFSITDYHYLTAIYYMNRPNFKDVAERLGVTKPAVSAMVRRLESIGLLEKRQSSEDRRIYYLSLSEKGKSVIEGDNSLYLEIIGLIHSLITPEQAAQVDCLLEQIVESLKGNVYGGRNDESKI